MGNPFDTAVDEINELQETFDKLTSELPTLQSKVEVVRSELGGYNAQVVVAQQQLDDIKEEITKRTLTYNLWQNQELEKLHRIAIQLSVDVDTLKTEQADHAALVLVKENDLVAKEAKIDSRIALKQQSIEETLQEAAAQVDTNTAWAKKLTESESQLNDREQNVHQQEQDLSERWSTIVRGEAELEQRKADVETVGKAATADRETARVLATGMKERIASTDAREEALDHKERQLKQKEKELVDKTAALNDRRNVMLSNGTL